MRQLQKLPLFLTKEMIATFKKVEGNEHLSDDQASLLMRLAIGLFCPAIDAYTAGANEMLAENYSLGYADGGKVSATNHHYHVPEGSSLAAEGSIVMIRPGDAANWKPMDGNESRIERVDASFAKQLQASIERNSRMVARLKVVREKIVECPGSYAEEHARECAEAIDAVLKDDPTWPA